MTSQSWLGHKRFAQAAVKQAALGLCGILVAALGCSVGACFQCADSGLGDERIDRQGLGRCKSRGSVAGHLTDYRARRKSNRAQSDRGEDFAAGGATREATPEVRFSKDQKLLSFHVWRQRA